MATPIITEVHVARFWAKVRKAGPTDCWEWTGTRNPTGYGGFRCANGIYRAHRIAWVLSSGRVVPDGLCVCHSCDNPPCCNPAHLWLGTIKDNAADRDRKKRRTTPQGERGGGAKLTNEQAKEIYRLSHAGGHKKTIGLRFGVSRDTVLLIHNGKRYACCTSSL